MESQFIYAQRKLVNSTGLTSFGWWLFGLWALVKDEEFYSLLTRTMSASTISVISC